MKYDELKEIGTEAGVKAAGKYRQEGKGYEVADGEAEAQASCLLAAMGLFTVAGLVWVWDCWRVVWVVRAMRRGTHSHLSAPPSSPSSPPTPPPPLPSHQQQPWTNQPTDKPTTPPPPLQTTTGDIIYFKFNVTSSGKK